MDQVEARSRSPSLRPSSEHLQLLEEVDFHDGDGGSAHVQEPGQQDSISVSFIG